MTIAAVLGSKGSAVETIGSDARLFDAVRKLGLSLVVWILKREVRAIGGCLGMHRR